MFDRIDSYIQEIEDLKEQDISQMSVSRILAVASNKALDANRADIHMKILDLRDEL